MNRRNFNKSLGLVTLTSAIAPWTQILNCAISRAQASGFEKKILLVRLNGGADCMVGLDPWKSGGAWGLKQRPNENLVFIGYPDSRIIQSTDSNIVLGPAASPMRPFLKEMSVVNGVCSLVDGHPQGALAMAGGSNEVLEHSMPAQIASYFAEPGGISLLAEDEGFSNPSNVISINGRGGSNGLMEVLGEAQSSVGVSNAFGARKIAKVMEKLSRVKLPQRRSIAEGIAEIFQADITRSGYIEIETPLDTHRDEESRLQIGNQFQAWSQVAEIINSLKNRGQLDSTVVMVFSEFSRQASRNQDNGRSGGKEHNISTNSVLLIGGGIRGGLSIGGSHIEGGRLHKANMFDFKTFQTIGGASLARKLGAHRPILPQDLKATIYALFGMSTTSGTVIDPLIY